MLLTKLRISHDHDKSGPKFHLVHGIWLQILLGFAVSLSNMSDGMSAGWSSAMIAKMTISTGNETATISLGEASLVGTLPIYASLAMTLFAPAANYLGRKWTILIGASLMFIEWLILSIVTNIGWIYFAVILRGLGGYLIYTISQIYLAEIAQANIRGFLGNFTAIFMNCGMLLSYLCSVYMSLNTLAMLAAGIAGLVFPLFLTGPESPYYLYMKNKPNEARASLQLLRGGGKSVDKELNDIRETVQKSNEEKSSVRDLFTDKTNRRVMVIVFMVQAIQQFAGIDAILLFLQVILGDADSNMSSVMFGAMKLSSCTLGMLLIDKAGRRPLLMFSSLASALALSILGCYFYMKEVLYDNHDFSTVSWIPLTLLLFYVLCYNVGLGSVNFVYGSEMFPTRFRALGTAGVQVTYCITMLTVTAAFAALKDSYGFYLAFWIFSVITFFGFIFCYLFVVETKGKTLNEIQHELK